MNNPNIDTSIYTDCISILALNFENDHVFIQATYFNLDESEPGGCQILLPMEEYLDLVKDLPDPNDVLLPVFDDSEVFYEHDMFELQDSPFYLRGVFVLSRPETDPFGGPEPPDETVFNLDDCILADPDYDPTVHPEDDYEGDSEVATEINRHKKHNLRLAYQYCRRMSNLHFIRNTTCMN